MFSQQNQRNGFQYVVDHQRTDASKLQHQNKLQHSKPDIYDFHVPRFPKINSSAVLSCGYLESTTAAIHEIQWLKDDIVFFSYRPTSQQIAHVFLDRDWLHQNSLSHLVETINVQGEHKAESKGFNITVVSLRFQPVTESLSGTFKCKLSVPLSSMLDSSIAYISSRQGSLSVIAGSHQAWFPEIGLEKSVGYLENEPIHLTCTTRGSPAPHLQWNYVREMIQREGEDPPSFVKLDILNRLMYSAVGRSKLKNYPLKIQDSGLETRTLGLTIICCSQKRFSCSLKHEGEYLRTDVEILEHGDTWRLEILSAEEEETTELTLAPEPVTEPVVEEVVVEDQSWIALNSSLLIGLSVSGCLLFLLFAVCCCCCCLSSRARRARQQKNKDIRRRQLYENGARGTRLKLGRRSTKRKAPLPLLEPEQQQQQ